MNKPSRRDFLSTAAAGAVSAGIYSITAGCANSTVNNQPPNVILIMTDDQGYGDLGCHGNDKISTPNIDRLYTESVQMDNFYVSPLCAPTRACLLTGRYNYRTGVSDVYLGRSLMYPDEVTIAEVYQSAGYETAIFGKWHLGDNHPLRPNDQGFKEVLVHNGGGIGQLSDPPGNNYFDPFLKHNGEYKRYDGYCTDIFFDEAIRYIEKNKNRPFFTYISTNAPHTPLQVAESYIEPYRALGFNETDARTYAMITNIDDNMGKLMTRLKELELEENTILIFMTDNGPQYFRYNAGTRGKKNNVYDGGVRVPCFIRWSGSLEPGKKVDRIAAHIDLLPTLLDACGIKKPPEVSFDGKSVLPLLKEEGEDWPDRTIFIQANYNRDPELYFNCMARTQQYKMVNGTELYNMTADPGEKNNIAGEKPEILARLRAEYEEWYHDVTSERGFVPPRIYLGTSHENPVTLTRNDIRGTKNWNLDQIGHWEVLVTEPGTYQVMYRFLPTEGGVDVHFRLGNVEMHQELVGAPWSSCTFDRIELEEGKGNLEAWLTYKGKSYGVSYVDVKKL